MLLQSTPRVSIHTLGCKLNAVESSALAQSFVDAGYTVVPFGSASDVVVVNTCTVTEEANRECRQVIRSAVRTSPDAVVAVTGCYAQLRPQEVSEIKGVSAVVGTANKQRLVEILADRALMEQIIVVEPTHDAMDFVAAPYTYDGRTRGFLKIQDGCDYTCTFCTIPLARGGSRSMAFADVERLLLSHVKSGFQEVVLTGVNIGEYLASTGETFADVISRSATMDLPFRLRVGSIEPNTIRTKLLDALAMHPRLCRHLHIPLQSGSASVLRRMRRRYNPDVYAAAIEAAHNILPGVTIGIDVIAGFPGESDTEFAETMQFLEGLSWTYLHVFPYSERANTPAATYADVVPIEVRRARTARLRALSSTRRQEAALRHFGTTVSVLPESFSPEKGQWSGWSDTYQLVRFAGLPEAEKRCVNVHCTGPIESDGSIHGKQISIA